MIYKVSLGFADLSDANLDAFTENVITRMTNNPSYPEPPFPLAELQTGLDAFVTALAAAAHGGKQQTAAKNNARAALTAQLRQYANYVQGQCLNNLPMLLSSGFQAISNNRAQTPLTQPVIVQVINEASTQLLLRVTPVANARSYEIRYNGNGNGTWQHGCTSTKARRIVLGDLTPGTLYRLQARAVGGSTGYSPWSDSVTHMAT